MKVKITNPNTIEKAIDELHEFLVFDLWYSFKEEFKTEKDMQEYLKLHFNVLHEKVRKIINKEMAEKIIQRVLNENPIKDY